MDTIVSDEGYGANPVSYTHLDVYKRQEMERVEDVMEYPMDEEAPESDTQDT